MSTAPPARLIAEIELYEAHKSEWLKEHQDEFVVIKDTGLLGFFSDFQHAYTAGVAKYGATADFLVKRVVAQEPVFVVY